MAQSFINAAYTEIEPGSFSQYVTEDELSTELSSYVKTSALSSYVKTSDLLNKIYPVGAIYMSVSSTSPATLFGGTWSQVKDTFLLACGSSYSNGATGGSATHTHTTASHTLTVSEIPAHTHKSYIYNQNTSNGTIPASNAYLSSINWASSSVSGVPQDPCGITSSTGGGGSHSHGNTGSASSLPPYLAVYVWKRTA